MTPLLADVIDRAINEILWDGRDHGYEEFSCIAVLLACPLGSDVCEHKAERFLKSLGCTCAYDQMQFIEFKRGAKQQYARALWLTWAAMIAREKGL